MAKTRQRIFRLSDYSKVFALPKQARFTMELFYTRALGHGHSASSQKFDTNTSSEGATISWRLPSNSLSAPPTTLALCYALVSKKINKFSDDCFHHFMLWVLNPNALWLVLFLARVADRWSTLVLVDMVMSIKLQYATGWAETKNLEIRRRRHFLPHPSGVLWNNLASDQTLPIPKPGRCACYARTIADLQPSSNSGRDSLPPS